MSLPKKFDKFGNAIHPPSRKVSVSGWRGLHEQIRKPEGGPKFYGIIDNLTGKKIKGTNAK